MQEKSHTNTCLIVHLVNQLYIKKKKKSREKESWHDGMVRNKYLKKNCDFSISPEILE